jgi:hypothetical protein
MITVHSRDTSESRYTSGLSTTLVVLTQLEPVWRRPLSVTVRFFSVMQAASFMQHSLSACFCLAYVTVDADYDIPLRETTYLQRTKLKPYFHINTTIFQVQRKMTAQTTKKVSDRPRMDRTERLRHRFYEPLLLLGMLNPRRNGGHGQPTIAFRNRNFISDWRRFLDALAWFGDYQHGGKTVTAVAAELLPAGVHFWVASTYAESATLIQSTLRHLSALRSASDDDRDAIERIIITQSVCSSKDKIDNYTRFLRLKLAAASSKLLPGVEEGTLRELPGE